MNQKSYAGMDVHTTDGELVGRVKGPLRGADAPSAAEYLVIDRPKARDIVVPRSLLRVSGDHLVLPFGMSVVEDAPNVLPGSQSPSDEEQWILDNFYSLWTGVPVKQIEIVKGHHGAHTTVEGE